MDGRKYWNKLKERLKEEGNETVTTCHQLKMLAADGKMRLPDVCVNYNARVRERCKIKKRGVSVALSSVCLSST